MSNFNQIIGWSLIGLGLICFGVWGLISVGKGQRHELSLLGRGLLAIAAGIYMLYRG